MLTMSMNSKRERRPNVRLEEIGNLPAAVSFVHKVRGDLRQNVWGCGGSDENTCSNAAGYNFDLGFYNRAIRGFACLDSVKVENSSTSPDMQQNIENKNPNSCKPGFGPSSSEDIGLGSANVAFGNVTRKRRVMKRKKRASNSGDCSFSSALNNSRLGSNDSAEDTKKHAKGCYPFNSFGSSDFYPVNGGTSYSGPEISTTSKQDFDDYLTEPSFDTARKSNSNELAAYHTGNDHTSTDDAVVYGVDRWLEDKGFGKYVEMFEMHEVDEEALPLLTLEDLKEMGVGAVGPRRKLYNAIQQLKRDGQL